MCAVKVLTEAEAGLTLERSLSIGGSGDLSNSNGARSYVGSGSGGRVVPHLTNPNCMVQVMPADAVLEPG